MNMHRYTLRFPNNGVTDTNHKETEMNDALKPPTDEKAKPQKAAKVPKAPKEPKAPGNRSSFSKLWPDDAKLTCLVKENPKKQGSASRDRFEHYFTSKTVKEFLEKGGTYADIAYDIARQRISVTGGTRPTPEAPKA